MVLYSRPGGTDEEKKFVETINTICDKCKHHLVEHRDDIEKWNLEESDLKRFNPLYWKRGDRGNIIEERGPTLYAKVMYSKKTGDIYTNFVDQQNGKHNKTPLNILNKHLENVSFGIKIESIFIGSSIMSLQLKLSEVAYSLKDTTLRSLLNPNIILSGNKNDVPKMEVKNEDHHNDDDKEEEEEVEEEIEEEVEEVEEEEVEEEEVEEEVVEVVTPSVPATKSKTGTTTRQPRQRKVKA